MLTTSLTTISLDTMIPLPQAKVNYKFRPVFEYIVEDEQLSDGVLDCIKGSSGQHNITGLVIVLCGLGAKH